MMFAKRLAVSVVLYFAALSQPINARVILAQELKKELKKGVRRPTTPGSTLDGGSR